MRLFPAFMRSTIALFAVTASLLFISSCQKSAEPDNGTDRANSFASMEGVVGTASNSASAITFCKTRDFCLWAGQTINTGKVVIANDDNNLYVIINSLEGFQNVAENVKIWVGDNLVDLPQTNKGTPIPGQFPYKLKVDPSYTWYTVTIPFSSIKTSGKLDCSGKGLYVYVHVDAIAKKKGETAWGGNCLADGPIRTQGRWYYNMTYSTGCCDECTCKDLN
jgi:hypothetical protein